MCKSLTLQLRRCRHNPRDGDYCGTHKMDIDENGYDNNGQNLAEICQRIRNVYFDGELNLRPQFSTELENENIRRFIFGDVMPFLRDCWKMGIANSNFPEATLRLHYRNLGEPSFVELPARQFTPEQRDGEHLQRRVAYRGRLLLGGHLQNIQNQQDNLVQGGGGAEFNPAGYIPQFPPFAGVIHRQNAGGIPRQNAGDGGGAAVPAAAAAAAANVTHFPPPVSNLPSISRDNQSVHRASVNKTVIDSIKILKEVPWNPSKWPILHESGKFPSVRKLFEHIYLWSDIFTREESKELFIKLFPLIENNKISGFMNIEDEVFGIKPWAALYKVCQWTWERPPEEKKEIFKRMLEEIYEGRDMCLQGKVSRIINILCGFHPEIHVGLSGKELLQDRMSKLAQREDMDPELRMEEGRGILRDADVPEEQWNVWLEPLLLF